MDKKYLRLLGYFDRNFGDDYMLKLIADSLPEYNLVIDNGEDVPPFLAESPNIIRQEASKNSKYPKLLVVGSGFMLNSAAAYVSELKAFIKGKRLADYCLGCNIEPFKTRFGQWLICKRLNKLKLIVCRDKKSYAFLKRHTSSPRVEYLPDILFSLPDSLLPKASGGEKLGVALMHRSGDTEDCAYYQKMAEAIDYWIEKTGESAVLMAFDSGTENDAYSCECVKRLTARPERVEIAVHKNGNEIFEAYKGCNRIISTRFHSAVLALRMGIPFYPIVFRDKMRNLIDDMAYPLRGSSIDDIDICDVKSFLDSELHYKLSDEVISASTQYARVFEESLNKDSEI